MNISRKSDVNLKYAFKWVFYFVLIGVMSGLGAVLFHYLCGLGMHYFMDLLAVAANLEVRRGLKHQV